MTVEAAESYIKATGNPFPGLRPFEAEESDLFFGREDDIFELLSRLRHMRFLAVVGASGCGKSSLIKAGLIASLTEGSLPGEWRVAMLRPWQSPITQLAAALSCPGVLEVPSNSADEAAAMVRAILQKGALGIVETLQRYPLQAGENLLILVDQFEELFTFMGDAKLAGAQDEARAFVKLLLEVISPKYKQLPVYVALTMRSDFLGNCALLPGLAEAINNGLYLLPQMEREQLRDAIRGPVDLSGAKISERLIDTLINDLRYDTDQLPILQHAMMRLWSQWSIDGGDQIDFSQYQKIGELSGTLCNHAEEVFGQLNDQQQQIAEALFRSITQVKDGKIVRRQTRLGLIRKSPRLKDVSVAELVDVINEFRAEGRSFLVPPPRQKIDDETAIDISHESLIRQWKRLRAWVENEALNQELYQQVVEGSRIWASKDRDESYLFIGNRLLEADAWSKRNPGVLNQPENDFLIASQNAYSDKLLAQPKKDLGERVVAEGATQAEAIVKESAHVFLAYAREDRAFAEQLREAFKGTGEETLVDWDILPSQNFEEYMRAAIEAADTFVYVISPSSVESDLCRQQLKHAVRQNKRIVPVLLRKVADWKLPEQLKSEHWVRFTGKDNFADAFRILREAINSDLFWVRAHTRLLVRATEWNKKDQDASQLLRGSELAEAEQWLGKENLEPDLTPLQRQYLIASRADASKRQKVKLAFVTMSFIVSLLLFVAAAGFAAYAYRQRSAAEKARAFAETQRSEAVANAVLAADEREKAKASETIAEAKRIEAETQTDLAIKAADKERAAKQDALRRKKFAESQQRLSAKTAEQTIDLVLGEGESPEEIARIAEIYRKQGDYQAAANVYRLLMVSVGPEVALKYYLPYARVLRHLGRNVEALNLERAARTSR